MALITLILVLLKIIAVVGLFAVLGLIGLAVCVLIFAAVVGCIQFYRKEIE